MSDEQNDPLASLAEDVRKTVERIDEECGRSQIEQCEFFFIETSDYDTIRAALLRAHAALDHIARTARGARSWSRRVCWIQHRAELTLRGEPYDREKMPDLPRNKEGAVRKAERQRDESRERERALRERVASAPTTTAYLNVLEQAGVCRGGLPVDWEGQTVALVVLDGSAEREG